MKTASSRMIETAGRRPSGRLFITDKEMLRFDKTRIEEIKVITTSAS